MAKFLQTIEEVRLYLVKASKYFKFGFIQLKRSIDMEQKKLNETNGEPPSKKFCEEIHDSSVKTKIKKRNIALLMAYNGTNYFGMQVNQGFNTIEGALVEALCKAGFIPPEAVKDLHLIHFQRAARTDKGVSAAKQIVSFKIAENFDIESINSYLPNDIKVFGIKRVTKGFNCKNQCFGRTYSYTLPTYALASEFHTTYPVNYRIQPETIKKVNDLLKTFVGTHSFHNFTSKKDGRDPSAKRYVVSFEAGQPFVHQEEFITLTVRGQSFMLHQIRKMIGYTIAIMKNMVPNDVRERVWNPAEKLSLPIAPGLGLVLEDVHYDKYNKKFGNDGMHLALTWNEVTEELEEFKQKVILSKIIETETTNRIMFNWLQFIPQHKYDYSGEEGQINEDTVKDLHKEEKTTVELKTENSL